MEISAKKTTLVTSNTSGINIEITGMDRSLRQSHSSSAWAQLRLTRLPSMRYSPGENWWHKHWQSWNDRNISVSFKIGLVHSLVTFIFVYACESWTLTAELQGRVQATEIRCYRKIPPIWYKHHISNEVRAKIQQAIGRHKNFLTTIKRRKLKWYVLLSCSSRLAKAVLQSTVKGGKKTTQTEKKVWI